MAKKAAQKFEYTGELLKPIPKRGPGLIASVSEERWQAALNDAVLDQMVVTLRKLSLLAEAHHVKPGDWLGLTLALARAHVPGFKVVGKGGRPLVWDTFTTARYHQAVNDHQRRYRALTLEEAMRDVSKLPEWADKFGKRPSPETRRRRYYSITKKDAERVCRYLATKGNAAGQGTGQQGQPDSGVTG